MNVFQVQYFPSKQITCMKTPKTLNFHTLNKCAMQDQDFCSISLAASHVLRILELITCKIAQCKAHRIHRQLRRHRRYNVGKKLLFCSEIHSGYLYYTDGYKKQNRSSQTTVIDIKITTLKNAIEWHWSPTSEMVGPQVKFQ